MTSTNSMRSVPEMNLNIHDLKLIWIVGATERLATLGFLSPELPLQLSQSCIDIFLEVDNHLDKLFPDETEIGEIFSIMARKESEEEISDVDLRQMVRLLLEYKNNRTEMVKHALSRSCV